MFISFSGNRSILMLYWKAGLMPSVRRGLYGDILTKKNVSIEHLLPESKGGRTSLDNLALATKNNNYNRKNYPLSKFLTPKQAQNYLKQFKGIYLPDFNGDAYIQQVKATIIKCFRKEK